LKTFSDNELSRLEQASELLLSAETQLPVLKTVAWERQVADSFFAAKGKNLPQPVYPKRDFTLAQQQISAARRLLKGSSPVHAWLRRFADVTELTARLLACMGTADFYKYSCELYGSSSTPIADGKRTAIELAKRIDSLLTEFDEGSVRLEPPESLTAEELKMKLDKSLPRYFGDDAPEVRISLDMSSKAAAGRNYIRIREDATFSDLDVTQLLQHEALIHIATGKNGRNQPRFRILGESFPGNAMTQEGLAVFAEFISGSLDPHRFKRLADRAIAIDMAEQGADFLDLYQYFLDTGISDRPFDAFESAFRVVRGGVIEGGAPFTKDSIYLGGLIEVHSYLRAAVRTGNTEFIRLLFVGKVDLGDLDAIKMLRDENLLSGPKFMPPWAIDLRYLLSYLAYSTFLNEINLVDVDARYHDLFTA
jgi:uncharacterized protein (TIGR02421 family)